MDEPMTSGQLFRELASFPSSSVPVVEVREGIATVFDVGRRERPVEGVHPFLRISPPEGRKEMTVAKVKVERFRPRTETECGAVMLSFEGEGGDGQWLEAGDSMQITISVDPRSAPWATLAWSALGQLYDAFSHPLPQGLSERDAAMRRAAGLLGRR